MNDKRYIHSSLIKASSNYTSNILNFWTCLFFIKSALYSNKKKTRNHIDFEIFIKSIIDK
jgi:hypothetical protein